MQNTIKQTGRAMIKNTIKQVLASRSGFDTLPLRVGTGAIFVAHGSQKLFGWFGGYGLEGTAGWMDSIGLGPGFLMAALAGSAEFFGGLAIIAGIAVRPTAIVLAFTMFVAIFSVHISNGLFMANNGYEFALALLVAMSALAIRGAGSSSVDALIARQL